ncbi:GNAT family N-acetyltransferase [Salisediminibacterium halotolerans]|uniref:L-amino acid N-acyltransferase YncA n=1 Tax=Salisediminibacterium halotolerans TaxID=517425 RepID=A0A1H9UK61_9BACI|nr:GNAT family N-acetyltransferase [Salisediminibacterium haloalkalitolerans]SES09413.1 L-amino acid N-acyltransferase YncA [Salisediminibacterium haloalkalitolerans]
MNIRQADISDAQAMARIHVDCWKQAYEGILPEDLLRSLSYEDRAKRWEENIEEATSGGSMIYVAEDPELGVIGFVLGGTMRDATMRMRYTGEIYGIYVWPRYQRMGIGRALFEKMAAFLDAIHHARAGVWILADHPDRPFFEKLGAEEVYKKNEKVRDADHVTLAYGIEDLSAFAEDTSSGA